MIIEDEHYYNNRYHVVNDIVEFERVYMVDERKFNNHTYEMLRKVYEDLPSYMGDKTSFPCWFGDEEKGDTYFITVSFEMSGIQFFGKLPISDFLQWEIKFNQLIENFPFKYQS
ncbi:hypothetical protein [Lederbergia lenta]|uniref:hypothetical protein n=1 Tax=Lederbergia lenta TaxID=1467 RepID=UPI00203DD7DD|nr:hypothetical protein [Lederbergia lenta]MCM3110066.1 hypothetical protein [Lederbergia lenta]